MSNFHAAGKRRREAERAKKKKEKLERKKNRPKDGASFIVEEREELPEISLDDIIAQTTAKAAPRKSPSVTNIFVGGLSWEVDNKELQTLFEPFGEIREASLVPDQQNGGHRGFGFVTFENREDANKAIDEMDGVELHGQYLKVNIAKPRS